MKSNRLLFLLNILVLLSVPFVFTHSFFNDTALSLENTFSAVSIEPTITPTPTIQQSATHIVISEVQISGTSSNQDFVELYNPTLSSVSLAGWRIRKKTSGGTISTLVAITAGKIIPSYGFFLWSNSSGGYDLSISADISNTNTLADNNSIEVQDGSGITIDQVGWGTGTNQFIEGSVIAAGPSASQSIERKARAESIQQDMSMGGQDDLRGNGSDTDNNSSDFLIRLQPQPQNSLSSIESL